MVDREIEALETLQHPNIIRLFEVIETSSNYYLILECISGGTLDDRLKNAGKYSEADAATVFAQMASAIGHMHRNLIVHRDLKAENVLMQDKLHVKICDFGFSKRLSTLFEMQHTHCGSLPYAAPELFGDKSYNGPQVDMWALGVLLFFMLEGELPFPSRVASELQQQISEGIYEMPENISSSCQNLITGLLETIASERYTIEQVTTHSWLRHLSLPSPHPRFGLTPGDIVGEDEQKARDILRKLGVSDQMVEETAVQGAKHPITGLFRVVLHRLHLEDAAIEKDLINSA
ncbi:serine/threonine-protein kinase NIM1 [Galendromus occidentalis]|uniref:Serine/threonine-protein kinase NIM1 n=1 Tax=Galendromus occidentalis TaxID=34638 RepID=A0AAJ7L6C0_9ACAR|nr:serine/threonine-protein kinase NIM1 [Galendromus occidentalis]